jgi:hypothetical protein
MLKKVHKNSLKSPLDLFIKSPELAETYTMATTCVIIKCMYCTKCTLQNINFKSVDVLSYLAVI